MLTYMPSVLVLKVFVVQLVIHLKTEMLQSRDYLAHSRI